MDGHCFHCSVIINKEEKLIKMIESGTDGLIRIWNFHSGLLLKKISVSRQWLYGICLWNNQYLLAGCTDKKIKLIDLKNGKFLKDFDGHNNIVLTIKKINHPKYGTCLLSQGFKNEHIKLWININ